MAGASRVYTWHSYRVGLAAALHAAGLPDPAIKLICRWLCDASLLVYRRIGRGQQAPSVKKSSQVSVMDALQGANACRVRNDDDYAALSLLSQKRMRATWRVGFPRQTPWRTCTLCQKALQGQPPGYLGQKREMRPPRMSHK